jgi:iron complex outermembrane recepter protein
MRTYRVSTLILTASAVVGLSPWRPVPAQDANSAASQPTNNATLQEVVVTARKYREDIQTVPIAVTAVSGEQLKAQSIKTVVDLQNVAPGLFIQHALDDPQSLAITMRGRKQDDASMAVDASISMSVDGLTIPRTIGMGGSMLDIARVEVLRGPQGTLYGRNSTGGAIGIYTNDPTDQLSGSIDVTGGNYATWNALGIANIPITDNLAARFVAQRGGNGGYEHFADGRDLGTQSNEYYRGKLKWSGSDNWQAVLSGHYEHERSNNFRLYFPGLNPANFQGNGLPEGGLLTLETEADLGVSEAQAVALERSWVAQKSPWYTTLNPAARPFMSDVERWDVGLSVSGDLTDTVQLRSITGVQDLRRNASGDVPTAIIYLREFPHTSGLYYSQELQLLGKTANLNWVVGAYGGYETGTDEQTVFFIPGVLGTGGTENNNGIRNTTLAGYAQATWEFVPRWHLTGGVRYTADTREVNANAFNVDLLDPTVHQCVVPAPGAEAADPADPTTSQCPRSFKASFGETTWLVSLDHQLTSNVLLYGKVATGYRSGGLNADSGNTVLETFEAFSPETNIEYETGFKSTFFDRRVRLDADIYWDDYTNLQVQTQIVAANQSFQTLETNAATARIKGAEVEADVIVGEGLTLHASTAYTDARYLKYIDLSGDHTNDPFSVPKWTYSLRANYTRPTGVGDASVELDYVWKSAVNVAPTTTPTFTKFETQPGYGLLNARLNLHLDAWNMDVAVFGQNLTNKYYFDQGGTINGDGYDLFSVYVGGPPRTFGIELVKKFGE